MRQNQSHTHPYNLTHTHCGRDAHMLIVLHYVTLTVLSSNRHESACISEWFQRFVFFFLHFFRTVFSYFIEKMCGLFCIFVAFFKRILSPSFLGGFASLPRPEYQCSLSSPDVCRALMIPERKF